MSRRGIRYPYDLRQRCKVDRETGCWRWNGACDSNGRPSFWFAPLQQRVSIGIVACWWATGARPAKGQAWHVCCSTPNCANPKHRVAGDRSSQMLAAGIKRSSLTRARITVGRRRHCKLSEADVHEIRTGGMTLDQIVDRFGISMGYASEVRAGKRRKKPVVLGSSVFAVGQAANIAQEREAA